MRRARAGWIGRLTCALAVSTLVMGAAGCSGGGKADGEGTKTAEPAKTTESTKTAEAAKKTEAAKKAGSAKKTPAPRAVAKGAVTGGKLPPSNRVWVVDLLGDGKDVVVAAHKDALWAARHTADGGYAELWRVTGPGVAQKVVAGDFGRGHQLYVARGVGRGFLQAPLVLQEIDPKTGEASELWRHAGERTECAHLSIADVDRDGAAELAFAHYDSKYFVKTRHLEANGKAVDGTPVRMATTRTYADLNGDGKVDEIVGRVYGDDRTLPGDLKVNLGKGFVKVPTDNGVKALLVTQLPGDAGPTLYFADGWVANYGKEAKAQLKRAPVEGDTLVPKLVARSPGEFTFFRMWARDMDGDGKTEIVAQGNQRMTRFLARTDGDLVGKPIARFGPVLNTAVGRDAAGKWFTYVPDDGGTRAIAAE